MRAAAVAILCLLGGAAAAATAPADPRLAIAALDACLPRLDPELDVGIARIEARCPGLAAALEASSVAATLPADWRRPGGDLSAGGLRLLRGLLAPRAVAVAARPRPDATALAALLEAARAEAAPAGPWTRFTRWLRARIEEAASGAGEPGAWTRWLQGRSAPARFWTVLGYLALLGLVGFVAWVVRAELRAAGWRLRRAPVAGSAGPSGAVGQAEPALAQVAVADRPAWLLRRLARRLQALGRLPPTGALTARELARLARLDDAADRESLRGIALAAERVRYGAAPPRPAELEPAIDAAQALLARLERPPAGARAAA
ncbi:MAG: hypothetical protein MUF07_16830 [Steroidobacteraceae bacterium]|nr:hypothetical protein [Steroidobacteraceae bacterium]